MQGLETNDGNAVKIKLLGMGLLCVDVKVIHKRKKINEVILYVVYFKPKPKLGRATQVLITLELNGFSKNPKTTKLLNVSTVRCLDMVLADVKLRPSVPFVLEITKLLSVNQTTSNVQTAVASIRLCL